MDPKTASVMLSVLIHNPVSGWPGLQALCSRFAHTWTLKTIGVMLPFLIPSPFWDPHDGVGHVAILPTSDYVTLATAAVPVGVLFVRRAAA